MDDLPYVLSPLQHLHTQPSSTAHVVDLEARCSAISKEACVLIGRLELAPLLIRHGVESKKRRTRVGMEVRAHHVALFISL
jgi:hypothetical protein